MHSIDPRRPEWLKVRLPGWGQYYDVRRRLVPAVGEGADLHAVLRELDLALGSVHPDLPTAMLGERGHREGGGQAPVELEGHDLMVVHVVVDPPHASPVGPRPHRREVRLAGVLGRDDGRRP